ncbi:MAG: hypothetical protein ACK5NI_02670 [bacterium]
MFIIKISSPALSFSTLPSLLLAPLTDSTFPEGKIPKLFVFPPTPAPPIIKPTKCC